MYRDKDLQECLFGLVGYRQTGNPQYPKLAPSLVSSSSGLYVQDEHPLLTIENLDQALRNYDAYVYPAYNNGTAYDEGEKVKAANGKVYESKEDNNQGHEPSASPDEWEEVLLLSQKLEAVMRSGISKVNAANILNKKLCELTKQIFENVQLFDGNGSLTDKEIKLGRFVGLKITLDSHRDLITIIRRIGTQFTAENPDFKLYIFHPSQEDPLVILPLNLTKVNSFQWSAIDYTLRYLSETYSPGGSFRIGYYEDLLQGQAINRGYDFALSPQPCNCNNWYSLYMKWSQFLHIMPFEVTPAVLPAPDGTGAKMWAVESEIPQYQKSYGLNLDLTVKCDLTDFFCREKDLFIQPILKQVAVDLLSEIAFSARNNPIAKETRDLAMFELETRPNGQPGMRKALENTIKALSFDTSDLNEACLPCDNSKGPRYTTF